MLIAPVLISWLSSDLVEKETTTRPEFATVIAAASSFCKPLKHAITKTAVVKEVD